MILAGDHVYKMDYELMLTQHEENNAEVTVACLEVPLRDATGFGVVAVAEQDRIVSFLEKPKNPAAHAGHPLMSFASMGIYVFRTKFLFDQLRRDAADPNSSHDFGKDIIPYLVEHGRAFAHRFTESCVRSSEQAEPYWRDVGTVEAYWQANIDLTDVIPPLDLYDSNWPIWSNSELSPPAKFVHDVDGRRGQAITSLVSGGCIVSGSSVRRSLLFTGVRAHSHSSRGGRSHSAVCRHRPERAAVEGRGRCQCAHSGRSCGRRGSHPRRAAVSGAPSRHLPHHPTDDRRAVAMSVLRVLAVASEFFPLVKTGGLADVVGALPAALATVGGGGHDAATRPIRRCWTAWRRPSPLSPCPNCWGSQRRFARDARGGARLLVIDAPHLYARPGNPYTSATGADWPDNAQRFAALAMVGALVARGRWAGYQPDAVHAHDWQAGLLPAYLRFGEAEAPPPPSVFTVHNLAFQGQFSAALLPSLGLPWAAYTPRGCRILRQHRLPEGWAAACRSRGRRFPRPMPPRSGLRKAAWVLMASCSREATIVSGIINGIDTDVWNPATDGVIAPALHRRSAGGSRRQQGRAL